MGKIVRNGITYGIDENEIKTTVAQCDAATGSEIAGAKALSELKTTLQSNFQAGVDSVYNAIVGQGTTPSSKALADVVAGVGAMGTNRYNAGVTATKVGTAGAAQVRSGYTFTNASGVGVAGTMANYTGATNRNTFTPSITAQTYTIPSGFHDGAGTVTCAAVSATKTLAATNGSAVDMGGAYRYVNTEAVYNSGKNDGYENGYSTGINDGKNSISLSIGGAFSAGGGSQWGGTSLGGFQVDKYYLVNLYAYTWGAGKTGAGGYSGLSFLTILVNSLNGSSTSGSIIGIAKATSTTVSMSGYSQWHNITANQLIMS